MTMLIEIHMIQNHSPSNLNRDDLGAPKTCVFGGVTRARISSQCLKRSIRNPGNPEDTHNRGPGMFAEAMEKHIGCRTKLFPWLVDQALKDSKIPSDEHRLVVLAAQRIAISKEKEEKKAAAAAKSDPRPKTRQLIYLGPGHANFFVQKLSELRENSKDRYDYFLNPIIGFQEMVQDHLVPGLDEKDRKKIIGACWVIAKCRMAELLVDKETGEVGEQPETEDDQPGVGHAKLIAERLTDFCLSDKERFKELTNKPSKQAEKDQLKEDAPKRPKKMDEFMEALKTVSRCDAVDIALFGRMTTSEAFEDVEAAMQVAHAISTHAVVNEVDYFTAVDDLGKAGGGAGHVDEAMFNSACFYKYFCLDWEQLVHNLGGAKKLAACTLGHFLRAAALTTPTGKQNSFASHTPPDGILVEIKKNGKTPLSYANAFAEPARKVGDPPDDAADAESLVGRSIAQLGDNVYSLRKAFGNDSTLLWHSPKLWRYPLRGWEREEDGGKKDYVALPNHCYEKLRDLVEAVVKEVGFEWDKVEKAGRRESQS